MFNSHLRKLCVSMTRSVKPTFTLEPHLRGDIGHNNWQFMNSVRHFRNNPIVIPKPRKVYYPEMPEDQEVFEDNTVQEMNVMKDVVSKVNSQISEHSHGRLFAVIYLKGDQYKVTEGDLLVTEGSWAPEPGDALRLEKSIEQL